MFSKQNFTAKSFSHKSPASLTNLGIIFGLGIIAFLVIAVSTGLMGELTGNNSGGAVGNVMACTSGQLDSNQKKQIQQNMSVYQAAADKAGINWEMLAAIHYRETSLSTTADNPFQITGAKYSGFNVNSATEAAEKLKGLAQGSYSVALTKSSSEKDLKLAFLAYNRGAMYKNGGCDVDQSPYVMNNFDAAHKDMKWPSNACEPSGTRGTTDSRLGAFTVYAALKGCASAIVSGNKALPINPSAITRLNPTAHGQSVSNPGYKDTHNCFITVGRDIGTGLPSTLGEAVDIYAQVNTPVYAPFDGRITHSSNVHRNDPSLGKVVIIKSLDSQSFAVMAHIQDVPTTGTQVTAGQKIGTVYPLRISGPHLHFELWVNNKPINAGPTFNAQNIWNAQKRALGF